MCHSGLTGLISLFSSTSLFYPSFSSAGRRGRSGHTGHPMADRPFQTTEPTQAILWSYVEPDTSSSLRPHTNASTRSGDPSPM